MYNSIYCPVLGRIGTTASLIPPGKEDHCLWFQVLLLSFPSRPIRETGLVGYAYLASWEYGSVPFKKRKVASSLQHGVLDLAKYMKQKSPDLLQTHARLHSD